MKKLALCMIGCGMAATIQAQSGPWTLKQCCDYAVEHNISIRQQANTCQQQAIQLQTSKAQRLPDLSASVGQNFSFGRGLTADNTYTNTNTSSTSFSVGTSVPLFTGFQIPNQIKLNSLNLEAATADLEKAKNDIRVQVAQAYVQILFDTEIAEVARRQVAIDSTQVYRLQELLKVGKASEAELSQQKATLAQSLLTATQADNSLRLAYLTLTQLLELETPEGFSIESEKLRVKSEESLSVECRVDSVEFATALESEEYRVKSEEFATANGSAVANSKHYTLNSTLKSLPSPDAIFAEAIGVKPEVQAAQLRVTASERNIDIARAGLYPSLSFSAGLGTNYYTTSGFKADGFSSQLKNNFSQYLGLNLSIPIFNRFQTRNSIRSARIERENQLLALDNTKKTLYKEIQTAYYNTIAAQEKLNSSNLARQASQDAFRLVQAKYENGKATITEFNESKNNYLKAESDLTQARYEYLYQQALIQFYRGLPLEL